MIRLPPRTTLDRSSAASDVYKRQDEDDRHEHEREEDAGVARLSPRGVLDPRSGRDICRRAGEPEWTTDVLRGFDHRQLAVSYTHLTLPTSDLV